MLPRQRQRAAALDQSRPLRRPAIRSVPYSERSGRGRHFVERSGNAGHDQPFIFRIGHAEVRREHLAAVLADVRCRSDRLRRRRRKPPRSTGKSCGAGLRMVDPGNETSGGKMRIGATVDLVQRHDAGSANRGIVELCFVSPASCLAHQNHQEARMPTSSSSFDLRAASVAKRASDRRGSSTIAWSASQASSHSAANASQSSPWARYTLCRAMRGCRLPRGPGLRRWRRTQPGRLPPPRRRSRCARAAKVVATKK